MDCKGMALFLTSFTLLASNVIRATESELECEPREEFVAWKTRRHICPCRQRFDNESSCPVTVMTPASHYINVKNDRELVGQNPTIIRNDKGMCTCKSGYYTDGPMGHLLGTPCFTTVECNARETYVHLGKCPGNGIALPHAVYLEHTYKVCNFEKAIIETKTAGGRKIDGQLLMYGDVTKCYCEVNNHASVGTRDDLYGGGSCISEQACTALLNAATTTKMEPTTTTEMEPTTTTEMEPTTTTEMPITAEEEEQKLTDLTVDLNLTVEFVD